MVKAKKMKNGKWRASLYLGKDIYGKKLYKDIYGITEKECNEKQIEFLYKKQNNLLDIEKKPEFNTFEEYWDDWIKRRIDIKDTTLQEYNSIKRCHLQPLLKIKAKELNQEQFNQFFIDLFEKGGAKIVKKVYRKIHTFLSAIDNEYINVKLIKKVILPKSTKFKPYHIKQDEYLNFLNKLEKEYDSDSPIGYLYILLYLCGGLGLRIGEALAIMYKDINFERKTINISKEQTRIKGLGYVVQETTKTESSTRCIAVPDFVLTILKKDYEKRLYTISKCKKLNIDLNSKVKYVDENNNITMLDAKDFVMCNNKIEYVIKNTAQRNWKKYRENLGYDEQIRIHDFRRFLATLFLKNNIPDNISKLQLGHSSEFMTQYYQNVDEELLVEYVKNLKLDI